MQSSSAEKSKRQALSQTYDYHQPLMSDAYHSTKAIAIIGYVTLIGWLVAIMLYGKRKSSFTTFHLRQSLGLIITGALLALVPLIGWLMNVAVIFVWLYAVYHAIQDQKVKVPILGDCYQVHLDFVK